MGRKRKVGVAFRLSEVGFAGGGGCFFIYPKTLEEELLARAQVRIEREKGE